MTIQLITNTMNAFKTVTDIRTGLTDDGEPIENGGIYIPFRANAAITKGAALSFVVPTASVPLSVKTRAASAGDLIALFAGVAMDTAAAAGAVIRVCVFGQCRAAVFSSTTVVAGHAAIHDQTNAGVLQDSASEVVAADLNGALIGFWQGVKDASNIASLWLNVR